MLAKRAEDFGRPNGFFRNMDENKWEFKRRGHPVTVSCGCHTQIWVKSSGHVASERPLSNRKPLRSPRGGPGHTAYHRPWSSGPQPGSPDRRAPPVRDVRLTLYTNERHDLIQETWVWDTQSVS